MKPYEEAEAREEAWDRRCSCSPKCSICGRGVAEFGSYIDLLDFIICEKCMNENKRYTDEEDWEDGEI